MRALDAVAQNGSASEIPWTAMFGAGQYALGVLGEGGSRCVLRVRVLRSSSWFDPH
jgi:hypothetical protein